MPAAMPGERSRFWLYAPYAVVLLLLVGWAGFWFMVKGRVAAGVDAWMVREAEAGRDWSCARRSIAGFPFRIEVKCDEVKLIRRNDPSAPEMSLGRLLVVAQVYDPRHIIAESPGPLAGVWADGRKAEVSWEKAQLSLRSSRNGFERASLVAEKPVLATSGFDAEPLRAARSEAHLRPAPSRAADHAYELSLDVTGLASAMLDQLSGTPGPTNIKLSATATRAGALVGGLTPATIEAWRVAGGVVELQRFGMMKGRAVLEGSGWVGLDELRRVRGKIDASQSGIDQIGGMRLGGLLDAGALFAGRPAVTTEGGRNLKPLPPVEARDGRIYLGPLRMPGPPLRPVY
ncbi:MAG: DUF2125 domain-containing protein [Bosea sp. (in: a-proteobacteria)]